MKISEMKRHCDIYLKLAQEICQLGINGKISEMLEKSLKAFPHIDPVLQLYKKGKMGPTPDLVPIDMICDYAPLIFEHEKLIALQDFINSTRRLAKYDKKNLPNQVNRALKKEKTAWELWNHLESNPNCDEKDLHKIIKVKQDYLAWVIGRWASLGVIVREKLLDSYKIKLTTNLEEEIVGVCIACGVKGTGKKSAFLKTEECPKCKNKSRFHWLTEPCVSNIREV